MHSVARTCGLIALATALAFALLVVPTYAPAAFAAGCGTSEDLSGNITGSAGSCPTPAAADTTAPNPASSNTSTGPRTCTVKDYYTHVDAPVPCTTSNGSYSGNCYYKATTAPAGAAPHVGGGWYLKTCYSYQYANAFISNVLLPPTTVWLPAPPDVPVPTGVELATQAFGSKALPKLDGALHKLPDQTAIGGATVVNVYTWFWVDGPAVKQTTLHVEAPGNPAIYVDIVAEAKLTVTPGDGGGQLNCAGPGTPADASTDLAHDASPSNCSYRYEKTSINAPSQKFTATYTATWSATYTAWDTPNPTPLPNNVLITATDSFPVNQIQSLVVGGR